MNEQELIDKGFLKYQSNSVIFPCSDYFYQKRFSDEKGIKYFVDVVHYPKSEHLEESWMINMNIGEPFMVFKQYGIKSLDIALEKCEKFFQTMGCEYYE